MMTTVPLNFEHLTQLVEISQSTIFGESWTESALSSELRQAGSLGLVDQEKGLRAFVFFRQSGDDAEITWLATATEARRTGLQSLLLKQLATTQRALGVGRLILEVRADNDFARAFYASLGFQQIGLRPRYYPGGVDALVLGQNLEA